MQPTDVREAAQQAVHRSRTYVERLVESRTAQLAGQIDALGAELHGVSDLLRQTGTMGFAAGYVDRGADAVDGVSEYLAQADTEQLILDFENLARRRPLTVAAGAFAVGFAASRFLKASSTRRYRASGEYATYAARSVSEASTHAA